MSDDNLAYEKPFSVEIAKQGRAVCKKCKQKCVQGELRIAKLIPNPLGSGKVKAWHHVSCIFEVFLKQRQTTKRIEGPQDIEGWELLTNEDKFDILKKIKDCNEIFEAKLRKSPKKPRRINTKIKVPESNACSNEESLSVSSDSMVKEGVHKDNTFRLFRTIVADVSNVSNSNEKINKFRKLFSKGSDGSGFKGDIYLWCKLLLPAIIKRVFHLQSKQLMKIFGRIFLVSEETMSKPDQGDIGQVIQYFFEKSEEPKPLQKSHLTLYEVDEFLETLTTLTKEEDQYNHFKSFLEKCTSNDLKVIIRLIKHDLRMNAGAKHVFEAIHPDAYAIFQSCRDIKTVINTCWQAPLKKEKSQNEEVFLKSPKKNLKRKAQIFERNTSKQLKHEKTEIVKKISTEDKFSDDFSEKRTSIPNYFEKVKLYLEDGVKEKHAQWIHYVIAYGGTVLNPEDYEKATHVLHLKDTITEPTIPCPKNARHVIVEWIKHTVEKESLQDYRPYTVRWKPTNTSCIM